MMITVFHGTRQMYGDPIFCPAYYYKLKMKNSSEVALQYAQFLLEFLTGFDDKFMLEKALDDAQTTSIKSPFISTSKNRNVARSFALSRSESGYIYSISGPEEKFYDFNLVRQQNGLPPHRTFQWMEELGIPLEVKEPFQVEKIERIIEVKEEVEVIFSK